MVHYHNMAISSCTAKFCGVMQPQAPKPPDCGDIVYTPARPHPHTTHSNAPKIAPSPCRFSARSFSIFRKIQKLRFRVRIVGSLQPFIWPAQICKPLSWAEECPWWWMGVTPQSLHGFVRIAWIMNHAMIWIRIIVDHNLNSVFLILQITTSPLKVWRLWSKAWWRTPACRIWTLAVCHTPASNVKRFQSLSSRNLRWTIRISFFCFEPDKTV